MPFHSHRTCTHCSFCAVHYSMIAGREGLFKAKGPLPSTISTGSVSAPERTRHDNRSDAEVRQGQHGRLAMTCVVRRLDARAHRRSRSRSRTISKKSFEGSAAAWEKLMARQKPRKGHGGAERVPEGRRTRISSAEAAKLGRTLLSISPRTCYQSVRGRHVPSARWPLSAARPCDASIRHASALMPESGNA